MKWTQVNLLLVLCLFPWDIPLKLLQNPVMKKSLEKEKDQHLNKADLTWATLNNSQKERAEGQNTTINGKYYLFGGFSEFHGGTDLRVTNTVEMYDPMADTWSYLKPMPHAVTHLGITVDGTKVWLPGGFEGNNPGTAIQKVQVYDTATDTWSFGPDLPEPMASHGVTRLGRKLHVFGGLKPDRYTDTGVHYALDLDNQSAGWQRLADLPKARNHLSATTIGGQIYAIGGQNGHDLGYDDVNYLHVYNALTDTWEQKADLPNNRSHFEPGTLTTVDGKIVIIGGRKNNNEESAMDDITQYDPDTDTWSELGVLPIGRLAPAAKVINHKLYVSHGGANWFTPKKNIIESDFERPERYELGFFPQRISVELETGSSIDKSVYLWTITGEANYQVSMLPSWITPSRPTGNTDKYGKEIVLSLNAYRLEPGTYNSQITVTADNYKDTTLDIELKVVKPKPKILYLYGNVDKNGYLYGNPMYNAPPYHQMRLNDQNNLGMSSFKKAVEEVGFMIEELYDQEVTLTTDVLKKYDVVILGSNQKTWSNEEAIALNTWVRNGGGLIAYSDSGFGGHWDNPAPAGINNEQGRNSNNLLTEQFGMYFFTDQSGAGGDNLVTDWTINHYLNTIDGIAKSLNFRGEGCSPIRIDPNWTQKQTGDEVYQIAPFQNGGAGGPVTISDPDLGNNVQDYTIDCAVAAGKIGLGRVVGTFDRNTFWNGGPGTDITEEDNRLYAQKLVLWAAQLEEDPTKPKVLYLYGNVDKKGYLYDDPQYDGTPYQQMLLNDASSEGMTSFKAAIEEAGFVIEQAYDQDVTLESDFLNRYDIIILGSTQKIWDNDEAVALNSWVRGGGGLIAYSDASFGGHRLNPFPAGADNEQGRNSNNALTEQFGMYFFTDQGGDGGDNLVKDWTINHYLNTLDGIPQNLRFRGQGCSPIRINPDWPERKVGDLVYQVAPFQNGGAGGPVTIHDPDLGENIQDYTIDCAVAAAEIGLGRVVGTFDRNTFWNSAYGTNIMEEDNRLYVQKLVLWASKREEESNKPKVLYLYGNVDKAGSLYNDPPYNGTPYQQMLLSDKSSEGMSSFKTTIEETGFVVEQGYDQDVVLKPSFLQQYKVIIVGSTQKIWTREEKAALNIWVRNGGGLIAYSDASFGGHRLNPFPAGADNEQGRNSNNVLTEQFGMYFFTDQGGDGGDNLVKDWTINHYLNTLDGIPQNLRFRGQGCSPIRINSDWPERKAGDLVYQVAPFQNGGAGGPVTIHDPDLGENIQDYTIDCAVAAAEIGLGRIVGTFDRNTFWNSAYGTNITEEDNRLYVQKLVLWASGTEDNTVQLSLSEDNLRPDYEIAENQMSINVFPNPVPKGKKLHVQYYLKSERKVLEGYIYSSTGEVLKKISLEKENDIFTTSLDLSVLSTGVYQLVINDGKKEYSRKLVITDL